MAERTIGANWIDTYLCKSFSSDLLLHTCFSFSPSPENGRDLKTKEIFCLPTTKDSTLTDITYSYSLFRATSLIYSIITQLG